MKSDVDGHEVQAPKDGDEGGEEGVAEVHGPTLAEGQMKHQR